MPSLYYHVPSAGTSILKPVVDQVITGFLDELDLLRIFKENLYIVQPFTANSQFEDSEGTPMVRKSRCDVEVNHILDKSQVPWPVDTQYNTPARGIRGDKKGVHTPILIDEDANIFMEHYTVPCGLDMNFTLTFQTYDEATRAFDSIQSRYKGSLIQRPFDIDYSYPLSIPVLGFLLSVQQAKQAYKNKTLLDYINDKKVTEISFDVRKSQIGQAEADTELMVRCQQLNALAQVTIDQREPEVTRRDNLPDYFTISFNMVFQFGRPDMIAIHTPVSVENTLLDPTFFQNNLNTFHYSPAVTGLYQDLTITEWMSRSYGDYQNRMNIVRMPEYDDWFHADELYASYKYRPLLIAHFTLDGYETHVDLKDLGDLSLHPIVQAILKEKHQEIFDYGGLFHIGIYADTLRLAEPLVSLSDDLILTITSERPDKEYHLILSETTEFNKTNSSWDDLLIRYRYFFPLTIEKNLDALVQNRYLYVDNDNTLLSFIGRLSSKGKLGPVLKAMVNAEEDTNQIFGYTQNASQLADYLMNTPSMRENYSLPTTIPTDPTSPPIPAVKEYYDTKASTKSRSLFTAFVEQNLIAGNLTVDTIPDQYLKANQTYFPYNYISGGYYGFNTPFRVFQYNLGTQRRTD